MTYIKGLLSANYAWGLDFKGVANEMCECGEYEG
jgi:hypothetical protein